MRYSSVMASSHSSSSPRPVQPSTGAASLAALGCGLVAFTLAVIDAMTSSFSALPVPFPLLLVGLAGLALGLREMSVRAQFSAQADRYTASRRELEAKNRWFAITEAHARVGHWRLDLSNNEIFWSNATYAIHGMEPGTPPSLDDALSFYHEDDRDTVAKFVEQSRQTGQSYTFRARVIGADGRLRYVDAGANAECAADGTATSLFGVIKDRTSEEEMQQELRTARDSAKASANAKGQFLARMSHEIRTPMNGLLGFAELLERSELTAQQRRHTDLIIDSGKTLQTLLNDILDLSKIEAGKTEINIKTVELKYVLNHVKQMTEPAAREKGINLICDIAPNVPSHVKIDGLRLRQILSNLLSNAIRFTDTGTVSLTTRVGMMDAGAGELRFCVRDTGTGIPAELHERVFDPFTQEHTDPTGHIGGTGLGLAISRQLADLMGGSLTLSSEPGQGSVFTLSVPLYEAVASTPGLIGNTSAQKVGVHDAPVAVQSNTRILLAEDFDINRELITDMMQQLGVAIECAQDGAQAITMIHEARATGRPYGLILMDLQMPNVSGLEATKRLRATGISEDELPIVALTANAFSDDIAACLAAGMQAHLAKPVSMQRLANALNRWAPRDSGNGPFK